MSKIITYKNSPAGKFCQIKLDDGNRILISIAQPGIKVYKLMLFGSMPSGTIFEISTADLFSEKYKPAREKLTEISLELDMLDVFKDLLLLCKSLEGVKKKLHSVFKTEATN